MNQHNRKSILSPSACSLRSTMQNRVNQIKATSLLDRNKGLALVDKWLTSEGGTARLLSKQLSAVQ